MFEQTPAVPPYEPPPQAVPPPSVKKASSNNAGNLLESLLVPSAKEQPDDFPDGEAVHPVIQKPAPAQAIVTTPAPVIANERGQSAGQRQRQTITKVKRTSVQQKPTPATTAKPNIAEDRVATLDEVISDGTLLILSGISCIGNGLTTCLSVQSKFPTSAAVYGFFVGLFIHIIISRFEMAYLTWDRIKSGFFFPLLGAVIFDAGTATDGTRIVATAFNEGFASIPSVTEQFLALMRREDVSAWISPATIFFIIGTGVALLSERWLRKMWRQFSLTYRSWREGITILELKEHWAL